MTILRKYSRYLAWWALLGCCGAILVAASAFLYLSPKLPTKESYTNIRLENPLRIFSADNKLIAEFGNRRSTPIKYVEIPILVRNALVASEDRRFYDHHGVDLRGLLRSVVGIVTGNDWGGGSTITMQVTHNFFFEGEAAYSRKFKEILLAIKMERELSKEEILELYLNRAFFGISAYGISAAARQYYDKEPGELTLAEIATSIGLLPSPNSYNSLRSPERALIVRSRVLRRMRDQNMIDEEQFQEALNSPFTAQRHGRQPELDAPYVAEMTRQIMIDRYGELALTDGFEAYTTVDSRMQETANLALQTGLEQYDHRHGYRGRENHMRPASDQSLDNWLNILARTPTIASLQPAFVQEVQQRSITALLKSGESVQIEWDGIRWAKRFINQNAWRSSPRSASEVVEPGDLVRVTRNQEGKWELAQVPDVNGGLVAIDPNNGAILSLVGGYDFNESKFNRITQAKRQPGSSFKPFLYASALENGYTAASLINDAPLARSDYRPENFNKEFLGPLRLKYALTNSKNLVSLRLYDALGSNTVLPYVARFGFNEREFPHNDLTVAIGSHAVSPMEMATGYTVFANGGYQVEPYLIERIVNFNDGEVYQAQPYTVCEACNSISHESPNQELSNQELPNRESTKPESTTLLNENNQAETSAIIPAPRVIDERVAYIMNSILRSVITDGSGRPANRAINRQDLAGKTGTTNDANDLWFSGFNGNLVTTVYVGFDQPRSLGNTEQAATVALPIWIDFMKEVLEGTSEKRMGQPNGLVTVRINRQTGLRTQADDKGAIYELFRTENVPDYVNDIEALDGILSQGGKSANVNPF